MKVLVVVDMQNDFIDGALGTKEAQGIVDKVARKVNEFDGKVYATLDTHYDDYMDTQEGQHLPVQHCICRTDGWKLNPTIQAAIEAKQGDQYYWKFNKNTFGSVALAESLQSYNEPTLEVELVGVCTGICVISNALLLKAFMPEAKITVDASCCACVTPESHENALRAMQLCQINITNWEG